MPIFTLAIGIAITAWVGIMGATAMLRTEAANKWFGEMLEQSPALMMVNGFGLFVAAALVGLNLLVPEIVTATFVKWALVGIGVSQLSTLCSCSCVVGRQVPQWRGQPCFSFLRSSTGSFALKLGIPK